MEIHPSDIPVARVFDVRDVESASGAAEEMASLGFEDRRDGFKVLMPKEPRLARRIGHTVTTTVNYLLKRAGQRQNIRYWTYHEDAEHYAIVMISSDVLDSLNQT